MGHPIIPITKEPIRSGIDLVNRGHCSGRPTSWPTTEHKQVTESERHSLGINCSGRVQRRGAKGRHDVIPCPIVIHAISPWAHFEDLLPIIVGEEEMATGTNRDSSGFLGEGH